MNKDKALGLLHQEIKNQNLRRHCYAVAAVMKSLASRFDGDEELWEISGLVHDIDYEKYPERHPLEGIKILEEENYPKEIIEATTAHAWRYREGLPEPKNKMEWSLYCCDELTGLVVAVTLIRPEKKLSLVTAKNIISKWDSKSFAAGVNRKQIENCEDKLGIPLNRFIEIALTSMQEIHDDLGL